MFFRISEDEFRKLAEKCQAEGARSISDLARDAVHRMIDGAPEGGEQVIFEKIQRLDTMIHELNEKLQVLNTLLDTRHETGVQVNPAARAAAAAEDRQ